jgi:hypothetical protein
MNVQNNAPVSLPQVQQNVTVSMLKKSMQMTAQHVEQLMNTMPDMKQFGIGKNVDIIA